MRQWPYTSPYYNPVTMRASVLDELSDYLIYGGCQLGFIQLRDRNLTGDLNVQLHDNRSRATFASSIRLQEPDVVVFFFLNWTRTNFSGQGDKTKRPVPPAKILLDLPQLPGNRANDTESEKSVPIANDKRDEVHGEKANDSTPSVQQRSGNGAKVQERMF